MMVGLMVALTDGVLTAAERQALLQIPNRVEGLTRDDRARLVAEIRAQIKSPLGPQELRSKLKAAPPEWRTRLADELVAVAAADGGIAATEVAILEKLFRQMDLDPAALYSQLHGATAGPPTKDDAVEPEIVPEIIPPGPETGTAIPMPARPPTPTATEAPAPVAAIETVVGRLHLDPARLAAIRNESAGTFGILADIFADPEDEERPPAPVVLSPTHTDETDDGLDGRHRSLLDEFIDRPSWPSAEFELLVRRFGLMRDGAVAVLNAWALDRFDDLLIEGDDPVVANLAILPEELLRVPA